MYLKTEVAEIDEVKGDKRDKDNKIVVRVALAANIKCGKCKTEKKRTSGIEGRKRYKGDTGIDGTDESTRAQGSADDKNVEGKKAY